MKKILCFCAFFYAVSSYAQIAISSDQFGVEIGSVHDDLTSVDRYTLINDQIFVRGEIGFKVSADEDNIIVEQFSINKLSDLHTVKEVKVRKGLQLVNIIEFSGKGYCFYSDYKSTESGELFVYELDFENLEMITNPILVYSFNESRIAISGTVTSKGRHEIVFRKNENESFLLLYRRSIIDDNSAILEIGILNTDMRIEKEEFVKLDNEAVRYKLINAELDNFGNVNILGGLYDSQFGAWSNTAERKIENIQVFSSPFNGKISFKQFDFTSGIKSANLFCINNMFYIGGFYNSEGYDFANKTFISELSTFQGIHECSYVLPENLLNDFTKSNYNYGKFFGLELENLSIGKDGTFYCVASDNIQMQIGGTNPSYIDPGVLKTIYCATVVIGINKNGIIGTAKLPTISSRNRNKIEFFTEGFYHLVMFDAVINENLSKNTTPAFCTSKAEPTLAMFKVDLNDFNYERLAIVSENQILEALKLKLKWYQLYNCQRAVLIDNNSVIIELTKYKAKGIFLKVNFKDLSK